MSEFVKLTLLSLALAGCAAAAGEAIEPLTPVGGASGAAEADEGVPDPIPEQCDAEEYRGLIGSSIAATTFAESPMLRAFSRSDIITQEYIPQRTNIVYSRDGIILRVYCG